MINKIIIKYYLYLELSLKQDKKRAILKLLFSNFFLSGKTLVFTVVKPFDEVLKCAERPIWLPELDAVLTSNNSNVVKFNRKTEDVMGMAA